MTYEWLGVDSECFMSSQVAVSRQDDVAIEQAEVERRLDDDVICVDTWVQDRPREGGVLCVRLPAEVREDLVSHSDCVVC